MHARALDDNVVAHSSSNAYDTANADGQGPVKPALTLIGISSPSLWHPEAKGARFYISGRPALERLHKFIGEVLAQEQRIREDASSAKERRPVPIYRVENRETDES